MLVIGVDPGTLRTGWGVVRRVGPRLQGVDAGVIRTDRTDDLAGRLLCIFEQLTEVVSRFAPSQMAVEDVFSKHARSALTLGQARGIVLLVGARAGLPVTAYPPALVKRSIAGHGQAPKEQLGRIVCAILGFTDIPAADATDALAIAITHTNAMSLRGAVRPRAVGVAGR